MLVEYITLGIYFISLPLLGVLFSKMNTNLSDYVRGGGQATWWLTGASMLMAGTSAFTFTGNASMVFLAGPTPLIIYVANTTALLVGAWFLAGWFRQSRAYTVADMVRTRFGIPVEQFFSYSGILLQPIAASIQLWALSVFAAATFGGDVLHWIIGVGVVVILYSTTGGKWAVMATDFVQSLILFSITILIAYLCWKKIGGFGEFFSYFEKPEFAEDYQFVKPDGYDGQNRFNLKWIFMIFLMTIQHQLGMSSADRYLAARDGREARRASLLGAVLMAFGAIIWFFPAMVARFLYGNEILAQDVEKPAETAYSFIAQIVLPNGLMGIMIAAMFSATMSSMDSGLNRQVGIIARNIVPRLRVAFGMSEDMTPRGEVGLCRLLTMGIGLLIIFYSYLFYQNKEIVLFDAYLLINSMITVPILLPLLVGLFVKRMPGWSYFVIFGFSFLPSAYSWIMDAEWTIQHRAMWIFIYGAAGTVVSMLLWPFASESFKLRVDSFFENMRTPVDFEKEIGVSRNRAQYRMLGFSSVGIGTAILFLLLLPNSWGGRLYILFVAAFVGCIGALLLWADQREARRERDLESRMGAHGDEDRVESAEP